MQKLLLISILFFLIQSCAVKNPVVSEVHAKRSIASVEDEDSEADTEANETESTSTPIAKPAVPATNALAAAELRMKEEIVSEHSDMFENESVKSKLKQMIKKLSAIKNKLIDRTGKFIEHKGVGATASAFVGVGVSKNIEFFVHEQKVGVFCAPAVSVRSDVGVELDLVVGQSMSCKTNEDYTGGFLGAFGGVSAEAVGLPAGVGVGYNVGINYPQFKQAFDSAVRTKKLSAAGLADELQRMGRIDNANFLLLYQLAHRLFSRRKDEDKNMIETLGENAEKIFRQGTSLSKQLLEFISSPAFDGFIKKNKLSNLGAVADVLEKSLTGCDSVGGALTLDLTLSPVAVGLQYADTKLLTEIEIQDIKDLTLLNTDILDSPFSYSVAQLRRATELAGKLVMVPFQLNSDECSFTQLLKL